MKLDAKIKLNDGNEIPMLGLGVFRSAPGESTIKTVVDALQLGYRHIDTATIYQNESDVGQAIKRSGIPRSDVFITTKLWNSDQGYESTLRAFDSSRKLLDVDYVDLYLLHWPVQKLRKDSWRALEKLKRDGLVRSIGVSNFMVRHLKELVDTCKVMPSVNQIEHSPFLRRAELVDFCKDQQIAVEAYSPLTKGIKLNHALLADLAAKYAKSAAQILLRWNLQKNIIVIPKSNNKLRLAENADIFDFAISAADMALLDALDEAFVTGWNPETAD